ncbi:MAG: ATP-dependent protease [Chloroflexi bacterium]|nr:MAG: ATP-dependent protease [Chloroflexota bacterium]
MEKVSYEQLRKTCPPDMLPFASTDELEPPAEIIGQERAVRALRFGLEMDKQGFNIYVAGLPGTGRTTAVRTFLEKLAAEKPVPPDWCYVHNFKDPYRPKALCLPPGKGRELKAQVKEFIEYTRREIPKAFESDEYASQREALSAEFNTRREAIFSQLNKKAREAGFLLQSSPAGLLLIPMKDGQPLSQEAFEALPEEEKKQMRERQKAVEAEVREALREVRKEERALKARLDELDKAVGRNVLNRYVEELLEEYEEYPEVREYLEEMRDDILENLSQFRQAETSSEKMPPEARERLWRKYDVNVLVDNSHLTGAPVVIELNPTYVNLMGRIEKEAMFGTLITDFTLIKAGALHRANGGYLVIQVEDLLRNPYSWQGLKLALANGKIIIEEIGERLGFITTKTLQPEPIPLDVKVVLIGSPVLYHYLYNLDEEFKELFKVKADFDTRMDRNEENIKAYCAFICGICQKENLLPFENSGMAKIVEYGSRLAGDQDKLSTRFADIADIIREAHFWASQEGATSVKAEHVQKALAEKVYRSNLVQERVREMIEKGTILIDTEGEVVGQVNGLSVVSLGDFTFGKPTRITATIGVGKEGIVDIERETKLGGPIHTKGVLILTGYLIQKYAQDKPLTLAARLVFEQSYEGVEGDSASAAEVFALLSALSGLPIKQGIAVTGSLDQKGRIQAIGGVNEKIEGFFEICKAKGLNGEQGVIIPRSNLRHLMLKEEVVEAVKEGKFHIYAIETVDEGIEILTGVKAGKRLEDGAFEKDSVNYLVDKRLRELSKEYREVEEEESRSSE